MSSFMWRLHSDHAVFFWSLLYIQSWTFAYIRLQNNPYLNGICLREQNQPKKSCWPLESCCILERGLDLSMQERWGL